MKVMQHGSRSKHLSQPSLSVAQLMWSPGCEKSLFSPWAILQCERGGQVFLRRDVAHSLGAACSVGLRDLKRMVCQNELNIERAPQAEMPSGSSEESKETESTEAAAGGAMSYTPLGRTYLQNKVLTQQRTPVCFLSVHLPLLYHQFSLFVGSSLISLACETEGWGVTC